jgi:hypothetical protein
MLILGMYQDEFYICSKQASILIQILNSNECRWKITETGARIFTRVL